MESLTWRLPLIAIILCFMAAFTSCGSTHYSPLDTYSDAVVKEIKDSTRHANEVAQWLNQNK